MGGVDPAYENTWRVPPRLLWAMAFTCWAVGFVAESWIGNALAVSGGIAIALTTPFFGKAFSKQSVYELDLKLALVNLRRENGFGVGVYENLPEALKPQIADLMALNDEQIAKFLSNFKEHQNYSASLVNAQAWIVGSSSAIAALGTWIGNLFFHCGSVTC